MRLKYSIGVAGTHGKTTTTSMVGHILLDARLEPTVIVGGIVAGKGSGASLGSGDYFVAEADEYDRSFLRLTPSVAVLTSLEEDHLDYYRDLDEIRAAFCEFANKVPFYGTIHLNLDDANLVTLIPELVRPIRTFGFKVQAGTQARGAVQKGTTTTFQAHYQDELLGEVKLPLPGMFNVRNALAAISVALEFELPWSQIQSALESFQGVVRRFQLIGECRGIKVYDDYAHHPTEVEVTLDAARRAFDGRLIVVFQPHLYSRTRDFAAQFAQALLTSDVLILARIYPAREEPIAGVTSELIKAAAVEFGHKQVEYIDDIEAIPERVAEIARPGDVVMTIGAGDIYRTAPKIVEAL
jgi:UDP-N-acetylmuramate--alanine ligase